MTAQEIRDTWNQVKYTASEMDAVINSYLAGKVTIPGYGTVDFSQTVIDGLIAKFVELRTSLKTTVDSIEALD